MKSLESPLGAKAPVASFTPLRVSRAAFGSRKGPCGVAAVARDLLEPKNLPVVSKLEWSRPLKIVKYPDPRLRAVNAKVGVFDDNLLELAKEMIKIMYEDDGVGLAAPQVGVNIRLMVFNPEGRQAPGNETILVNPEVVSVGSGKTTEQEGCLSFPKVFAKVERPRSIVIKAQNEKGEPVLLQLGGSNYEAAWISRIFQHEYDHLQGILFHDRMKSGPLDSVRPALVQLEQEFLSANPDAKIQRVPPPKAFKGF